MTRDSSRCDRETANDSEADGRTRTGDPFITMLCASSAGIRLCDGEALVRVCAAALTRD
jgi:hypothetical protein